MYEPTQFGKLRKFSRSFMKDAKADSKNSVVKFGGQSQMPAKFNFATIYQIVYSYKFDYHQPFISINRGTLYAHCVQNTHLLFFS